MVKSFKITEDERLLAMYAGMVTSAFALAEFLASIFWGRLSDRVGRKPILLTGMAGTGISMVIFGFAPSLPVALFARALGGILNGCVHDVYTDFTNTTNQDPVTLVCFRQLSPRSSNARNINVSDYLYLSSCMQELNPCQLERLH
jgi:MFS family permease